MSGIAYHFSRYYLQLQLEEYLKHFQKCPTLILLCLYSLMSQSLIKKAFCFAQYSCIGRLVARSVLNGKVNPNHDVYRNTDPIHLDVFRQLSIHEKSVEKLYEIFCEIDRDGSGEISHYEFFRFFRHKRFPERSKFSKKVFKAFDLDGSGEIDFQEFVLCLWNFCSCTKDALFRLSFELYDTDRSGYLDEKEMRKILRELYGKNNYEKNQGTIHILKELKKLDGELNYVQFTDFARRYPALLFPAFRLQACLQQNILGTKFWEQAALDRMKLEQQVTKDILLQQGASVVSDFRYSDLIAHLNDCAKYNAGQLLDSDVARNQKQDNNENTVHKDREAKEATPQALTKRKSLRIDTSPMRRENNYGLPKKSGETKQPYVIPKSKLPDVPHRSNGSPVNKKKKKKRRRKKLPPEDFLLTSDHAWICTGCGQMNPENTSTCYVCLLTYQSQQVEGKGDPLSLLVY